MMRRKESFLDVLVSLPWWVAASLAVIAFVGLRFVLSSLAISNPFLKALASVSPTLAPIAGVVFGLAALMSAYAAWQRHRLLDQQASIEDIRKLDWLAFEKLVGEAYRRSGYAVRERGLGGADGGVDLELRKGNEHILVQCKHWKSWKVGVTPLREWYGVMAAEKATDGIFVASGEYSQEARLFAKQNNLRLVDGGELVQLVQQAKDVSPTRQALDYSTVLSFLIPLSIIAASMGYQFIGKEDRTYISPTPQPGKVESVARLQSAPVVSEKARDRSKLVREAKARFESEYVPPPGCENWTSDTHMVACTNHLIQARRTFIQQHPEFRAVREWEL